MQTTKIPVKLLGSLLLFTSSVIRGEDIHSFCSEKDFTQSGCKEAAASEKRSCMLERRYGLALLVEKKCMDWLREQRQPLPQEKQAEATVQTETVIEVPPQYQGVWVILGASEDGGNTWKDLSRDQALPFGRVSSTKILFPDGTEFSISRIRLMKLRGVEAHAIDFSDRQDTYLVSGPATAAIVIILRRNGTDTKEIARFKFFVRQ